MKNMADRWDEATVPYVVADVAQWMSRNGYKASDIIAMLKAPHKYRLEYKAMLAERERHEN